MPHPQENRSTRFIGSKNSCIHAWHFFSLLPASSSSSPLNHSSAPPLASVPLSTPSAPPPSSLTDTYLFIWYRCLKPRLLYPHFLEAPPLFPTGRLGLVASPPRALQPSPSSCSFPSMRVFHDPRTAQTLQGRTAWLSFITHGATCFGAMNRLVRNFKKNYSVHVQCM